MDGFTFFVLLLLVAATLGISYINIYNKFQNYFIKINEVESKIDISLRERFDLLCKAATFIKESIDQEVMSELSTINDTDISSFDFERKLSALTREFYNLKYTNRTLVKVENFTAIDFTLRENDAELDGYIAYYNDNISKLNRLVRMFPSNIIAKIANYNEKTFYDGKNMNDKKVDDFKL